MFAFVQLTQLLHKFCACLISYILMCPSHIVYVKYLCHACIVPLQIAALFLVAIYSCLENKK